MTDPFPAEEATLFPKTAGERLREAREAQGLSLTEIAARTRVPVRQLEAIEQSNYAALPSITYSVGFAKAYARAVGIDEVAVAREVRGNSTQPTAAKRTEYESYAVDESSARLPTRALTLAAVIAAVLVVVAAGLWYGTNLFRSEDVPVAAPAQDASQSAVPEAAPPPVQTATPGGPVVLTATDEVWLKVYDNTGKTLYLGTLTAGERYDVPADAAGPLINVGRPDKLQVTVGGQPVAPLGDGRIAIKDVPIDAASLVARTAAQASVPGRSTQRSAPSSPPAPSSPTRRTAPPRERQSSSSASAPLNIAAPLPVAPEPAAPAPAATPAP